MSKPIGERPFIVDLVIAKCNGCQQERRYAIDPPFRSAQDFIDWEKKKPISACSCGHPTADLKLRIVDPN